MDCFVSVNSFQSNTLSSFLKWEKNLVEDVFDTFINIKPKSSFFLSKTSISPDSFSQLFISYLTYFSCYFSLIFFVNPSIFLPEQSPVHNSYFTSIFLKVDTLQLFSFVRILKVLLALYLCKVLQILLVLLIQIYLRTLNSVKTICHFNFIKILNI